jgi:hypothetical protein
MPEEGERCSRAARQQTEVRATLLWYYPDFFGKRRNKAPLYGRHCPSEIRPHYTGHG